MAEDSSEVVEIDLTEWKKLKVGELRKKISDLGLDNKGTKAELIGRLEKYLSEQEVDLLEEEEEEELEEEEEGEERVMEEGTEEEEPSGDGNDKKEESSNGVNNDSSNSDKQEKKEGSIKISGPSVASSIPVLGSGDNQVEKLKSRQDRFGQVNNDSVKKQARAARFGLAVLDYQGLGKRPGAAPTTEDVEKLKKRAGRFGTTTESQTLNKITDGEKKSKRQERFGLSTIDSTIKNRKERFSS